MSTEPGAALVVATENPGKLRELRSLLAALPLRVRGLDEAGPVELPPEGSDYRANAVAKALATARALGLPALADDSGLEVDALAGAPGPHSARWGGPDLDDAGRTRRLLAALASQPSGKRGARFVCVVALALPDGSVEVARGACAGRIATAARGESGFGYDPVFLVREPELADGRTMAELRADEKNRISHRARAVRALLPALRARLLEAPGQRAHVRAAKRS